MTCQDCEAWGYNEVCNHKEAVTTKATDRIFVYGTLLTGEALEDHLPSFIRQPAKVRGHLNYVQGQGPGGFPVLRHTDQNVWVHGELCHVNMAVEAVSDTITMELDAGYNCQWRDVFDDKDELITHAMVFVWPWNEYGAAIPGGDWRKRYSGGSKTLTVREHDAASRRDLARYMGQDPDEQEQVEAAGYDWCDGCGKEHPVGELRRWDQYLLCGFCHPGDDFVL